MNLFFESSGQARVFLAVLPLGFLLALAVDLTRFAGRWRPVWDALCLLLGGVALMGLLLIFQDRGVRGYHALALALGAILYVCGVGSLARRLAQRVRFLRKKPRKSCKDAGESKDASKE